MYEISNIALIICLVVGFSVGAPAFLNQFVRFFRSTSKGIAVRRLLWGTREIPWGQIESIKISSFGSRVLDVRLLDPPLLSIHRNYLLILPREKERKEVVLSAIRQQGFSCD